MKYIGKSEQMVKERMTSEFTSALSATSSQYEFFLAIRTTAVAEWRIDIIDEVPKPDEERLKSMCIGPDGDARKKLLAQREKMAYHRAENPLPLWV